MPVLKQQLLEEPGLAFGFVTDRSQMGCHIGRLIARGLKRRLSRGLRTLKATQRIDALVRGLSHVILCEINSTRPDSQSASALRVPVCVCVCVWVLVQIFALAFHEERVSDREDVGSGRVARARAEEEREAKKYERIFFIIFARNANNTRGSLLIL